MSAAAAEGASDEEADQDSDEQHEDEEAQDGYSDAAQERTHKAFDAGNAPEPGSAPPVSTEERAGVSSTDTEPDAALGVGESSAAGAEEQAPDRDDVGHKGPGRPVGTVADDS